MADNWILYRSAAYLRGRGVTFGSPLVPSEAINSGVYSISLSLVKGPGVSGLDASLDAVAHESLNHFVISPIIAAHDNPRAYIKEASSKLRKNGHLIVIIQVGEVVAGRAELYPKDIDEWVSESGRWICKGRYEQNGKALHIYKKVEGRRGITDLPKVNQKRCLVVRYGALGDAIVLTPLLKQLHQDGYHVTLNSNPYCLPALENNPYIHNLLVQERDVVPNLMLGDYWNFWKGEYDKVVNLSESIEGDLLYVEGRPVFFTSKEWRHKTANKNYYDYTLARGGYPSILGTRGELFFTQAEERRARETFESYKNTFTIIWALNGSSHHKVYPLRQPTLNQWFETHPDSKVITVGDTMAQLSEYAHPNCVPKAGVWSVRESLIAAKYADLVIGPETMMTNAAGCFATPKITLLSHSTHENLCKYWENDYCLAPDVETAPCYPCHQLHYTKESCPMGIIEDSSTKEQLGDAPICSLAVSPQRLLNRMEEVYQLWKQPKVAVA